MKKKDIKLFNKATHKVKRVITEISDEREIYHKEVTEMREREIALRKIKKQRRKSHDKAVKRQIKELLKVVDEMYQLFDDLSNGKEYCKHIRTKLDLKILNDGKHKYCYGCGKAIKFNGGK